MRVREDSAAQLASHVDEPNLELILLVCGYTKLLWRTPISAVGPHRSTIIVAGGAAVAGIADLALEPSVAD